MDRDVPLRSADTRKQGEEIGKERREEVSSLLFFSYAPFLRIF